MPTNNKRNEPISRPTRRRMLSCGVVIVRLTEQGHRYLLLRAFRNWDFPKGKQEDGETPMQTALREVQEETGITELDFAWGEHYTETLPYDKGKVARYYLAGTEADDVIIEPNPETGLREHEEYAWLDYVRAMRLISPRVRRVLQWAAEQLGDPALNSQLK